MGELYMDDIDRALAREHKHYGDGYSLSEERRAFGGQQLKKTDPLRIIEISMDDASDNQCEADLTEIR
jgi:hypothetical protein